jgi:hypothetical protein
MWTRESLPNADARVGAKRRSREGDGVVAQTFPDEASGLREISRRPGQV